MTFPTVPSPGSTRRPRAGFVVRPRSSERLHHAVAQGRCWKAKASRRVVTHGLSITIMIMVWLVVWLPFLIFPDIGNVIIPIDFHVFSEGWPNHQPVMIMVFVWIINMNSEAIIMVIMNNRIIIIINCIMFLTTWFKQ